MRSTSRNARRSLAQLEQRVIACQACPRLVAWREEMARVKRASFRHQTYWGKPIPGFGDPQASVLICGLAPAAHGANRTGRVFTGDRSGDWLYAALHRAGFANQPHASDREDGLQLSDCFITTCVRCCPPANQPTAEERDNCRAFLVDELLLLTRVRCIVCLGGFAWAGVLGTLRNAHKIPRPRPRFAHGNDISIGPYVLLGCYHPSQQNTFTGRLTEPMLDSIFTRARAVMNDENG